MYRSLTFIISMTYLILLSDIWFICFPNELGIYSFSIVRHCLTAFVISSLFPGVYWNRLRICMELKKSNLSMSNLAPDFEILSRLNQLTMSGIRITSCFKKTPVDSASTVGSSLWGGFHPSKAIEFIKASGRKPFSLQLPTETSPNRFDSFCPFQFSNSGRCANSGGSSSNILYKRMCFGVDGSHSFIDQVLNTYFASNNMRYAHQVVVHYICKVVSREPVIF